jgi:hypothetical protein
MSGCEVLRITHFLANRLTNGGDVSLMHRPRSTPQKPLIVVSDIHFSQRLSKPQVLVRL